MDDRRLYAKAAGLLFSGTDRTLLESWKSFGQGQILFVIQVDHSSLAALMILSGESSSRRHWIRLGTCGTETRDQRSRSESYR